MRRIIGVVLRYFQIFIGAFMMYAGIATIFLPINDHHDSFGWIYDNRLALTILGIIFFLSGSTLFFGKILHKDRIIGWGLMAVYLCYLFAGVLNWYALGFGSAWTNLLGAAIVGLLYLRWKYHLYYAPAPVKE